MRAAALPAVDWNVLTTNTLDKLRLVFPTMYDAALGTRTRRAFCRL